MKDKVIETAGKTWKLLGQYGETSVSQLPQLINEQDNVVYQALGWLAREDKITYNSKNRKTFVSLAESELEAFKRLANVSSDQAQEHAEGSNGKKNSKNRLKQTV